MSEQYVDNIIDQLLQVEGEYVNHPDDKGGPTRWGVTEAVAKEYGYIGDMKEFPLSTAKYIYTDRYWRKPGFNQIALMSSMIAEELFDTGVNMGPSIPSRWLQRWLNVFNRQEKDYKDIPVDGQLGIRTYSALRDYLLKRGTHGEKVMVSALNCSQGARYLELAEGREANESFVYGWIANRVTFR